MGHHQLSSEPGTCDGISKFKDGKHGDKVWRVDGGLDIGDCEEEMGLQVSGSGEAKTEKENKSGKQSK